MRLYVTGLYVGAYIETHWEISQENTTHRRSGTCVMAYYQLSSLKCAYNFLDNKKDHNFKFFLFTILSSVKSQEINKFIFI